jgi:two-component system OmpR family sensor kinase
MLARSLDKERAIAAEERNFIRTMSHEFRTPLTNIDGQAQRLLTRKDRTDPAEIAERANKIRAAAFRMTNLVASLTEAMERTRSAVEPRMRVFDLRAMLLDLMSYYREIGAGGPLDEHIESLPAEINGDPELLHFAFSNLISNAFKYSPEGESVTLKARAVGGWIEIDVEDHGVGIPEAEIERVRERYFRGSNVGSIPGTGLGLHLVDEIVREHGGRFRIDSRCGEGTRVTVCLPNHSDASAGESHK